MSLSVVNIGVHGCLLLLLLLMACSSSSDSVAIKNSDDSQDVFSFVLALIKTLDSNSWTQTLTISKALDSHK